MYSLFSTPSRVLGGQLVISRFRDVSRRIAEDVDRITAYYRSGTSFTKIDHLLVRLIMTMDVPLTYPLEQYYNVAIARYLAVADQLRLTTSIGTGSWFNGVFYYGCHELVLGYSDPDPPFELAKDWRNLSPVKVLECPVSNLWYMLPDGRKHNTERGLAVIGVDIPQLMVMFRCFMLEELRLQQEDDQRPKLGIRNFLGKFVIPNMLYSQTDLAINNRLINLFYGAPMGDSEKRQPMHVSDYRLLLDKGLLESLKQIQDVRHRYRDDLEQIPKVFSDAPLEMPDMAETIQVWWALFLTRLKEITFLVDVAGAEGRSFNQTLLNELKIDLKRFQSDNIFKARLPKDFYPEVKQTLDRLMVTI